MKNERVIYWTEQWPDRNFGDYITEYLLENVLIAPFIHADRYRLIGSVIDEWIIENDLRDCGGLSPHIVFWCCGARSAEPLKASTLSKCSFFGARGPMTQKLLGATESCPIGDPALLIPLILQPEIPIGRTL